MFLAGRKIALGQDDSALPDVQTVPPPSSNVLLAPISLSASPLMLMGIGLFFVASLAHFTSRTTKAVARKGKAVRRALRA